MRILVDADSMSPRIRSIVARAAARHGLETVFVANRRLPLPDSPGTLRMAVADDADGWIVANVVSGDLVISRDVPLAARVIERGAEVISDHGEHYTSANIGARLSERAFAMRLRDRGELDAGPGRHADRDAARRTATFANELDRELTARSGRTTS